MMNVNTSVAINTIVMLSVPLDRPVLSLDLAIDKYYRDIHQYWTANRKTAAPITNGTNTCCAHRVPVAMAGNAAVQPPQAEYKRKEPRPVVVENFVLDHVLMVSIGGGSRDVIVSAGYTDSVFSDVHAMVRRA